MKRALLFALLLAVSACSSSDGGGDPTGPGGGNNNPPSNNPPTNNPPTNNPTGPQTHTITLEAASFAPASLTIKVGDTVVWVNSAAITHTVTPQGHAAWQSADTNAAGEVMRMTFNTAGSYTYFCQPHSATMTGVIIVQA